jgi:lycopene cyclase domain-containing protein
MPEYTVAAVVAVGLTLALERFVLRTGLLRTATYWVTMLIVFGFQCLVDGWLTKRDHPIVSYSPDAVTGIRFPWDVPVEDFLFGFALLTPVLLLWEWSGRRERRGGPTAAADQEMTSV